jgi:hypothetical protein
MCRLSLEQASLAALRAAQGGDLGALQEALVARQAALDRGDIPTPGVLTSGELTAALLREMIRDTRFEDARLRRLINEFANRAQSSVNVRA